MPFKLATALVTCTNLDRSRFVLLTADAELEAVSRAEGLDTDNPLNH